MNANGAFLYSVFQIEFVFFSICKYASFGFLSCSNRLLNTTFFFHFAFNDNTFSSILKCGTPHCRRACIRVFCILIYNILCFVFFYVDIIYYFCLWMIIIITFLFIRAILWLIICWLVWRALFSLPFFVCVSVVRFFFVQIRCWYREQVNSIDEKCDC